MKLPLTTLFFLMLVKGITAQPLDWGNDVTVFGSVQNEFQPCVTAIGTNLLHAFCMIGNDTMAVKRSGSGGAAWSTVSKSSVPWSGTRICCAEDNDYSYLIAYSTELSLKQLHRFDVVADDWTEAQMIEIPVGFGSNVDRMVVTTDRVIQPDDPYIHVCWTEGLAEGAMNVGFVQSRDQGNTFEPASLVHSTSLVPQAPSGLAIAVTWGEEAEALHIGVTRDRAGAMPEEVVLFTSSNHGLNWTDPVAVDPSTYSQREPTLAGYVSTLFLAYSRRSDVTAQRDIYFVYSPDGGMTFSEPLVLTDSNLDDFSPRVAVDHSGRTFHVFYLSGEVLADTSTLMVVSGLILEPWDVSEAIPISEAGMVWSLGDYSVSSGPAGVAAVWTTRFQLGDQDVLFDAAWRGSASEHPHGVIPLQASLGPCYPNPFNVTTTVPITLPSARAVELIVSDVLGRRMDLIALGSLSPGQHRISLDFSRYSTGSYWVRLKDASSPPVRLTLLR